MENHTNSSNISSSPVIILPQYWNEPLAVMAVRLFFEVAIAFFGVLGNISVCFLLSCQRSHVRINTAIRNFLLNLAIADLCVLLLTFPLAVVREQSPFRWLLGEFICLYVFPLCDVFIGVSIWSLTAVAIERYRIIKGASQIRQTSALALLICLAIIWILSFFGIAFPLLLHMKYSARYKQCNYVWPRSTKIINPMAQLYIITQIIFWFCLPLFIIRWTYSKIGQWITKSVLVSNTCGTEVQSPRRISVMQMQHSTRIKQSSKAKRLLTPLVLVFIVTLSPSFAFRLVVLYMPGLVYYRYSLVLYNSLIIMTIINSAINPVIYCLVSRDFRQGIKRIWVRCLRNVQLSIAKRRKSCWLRRY